MEAIKIFYSYSSNDKTLREELHKHLASFRNRGICQDWYDGEIRAGDEWHEEIKDKLASADFILLLISSDFLSSDYIRTFELGTAMQRHQAKEARVIPIMLRPCDFTGEVFSKLAGLPTKMKAVTTWANQDEAWTDVVRGLRLEFEKFRDEREARDAASVAAQAFTSSPTEEAIIAESQVPVAATDGLSAALEKNRELAETSTKAFQGLSQLMGSPKIKSFVAEQQGQLVAADQALQILVDYKNVHDMLHDLQFKCYNYILQEGRKLEDQIDWPLLVQPQKDLASISQLLEAAASQESMADEDFSWLEELRASRERLSLACDQLSPAPLKEARDLIKTILQMRPTIFDTKLCAAARTLPLEDLQKALCAIRVKLGAGSLEGDAGASFSAGVDAFPELSANLKALTTEHTRWQVIETRLWSIDALIDRDFSELQDAWPQVRERLVKVCDGNRAPWAISILEEARKLDDLLKTPPLDEAKDLQRWKMRVRQSYRSCSNDSGTRFYQVDLSLKRLCDQLRGVQAALVKILQRLL
jgi:hypothetical protein